MFPNARQKLQEHHCELFTTLAWRGNFILARLEWIRILMQLQQKINMNQQ